MLKENWLNLQLFAGEGAGDGGGEAAATGETSADAGHQRLRELGVPEDKIRKNRAYKLPTPASPPAASAQTQDPGQEVQQAAAATDPTEGKTEDPQKRLSWDEIKADPEYNREIQAIVQARLKTAKDAEVTMGKLTPALEVLARHYGQDPTKIDYEALAATISSDNRYYEDRALEMGVSLEMARKIDTLERDAARQQRDKERTIEQQRIQQHFMRLEQQSEELKKVFPSFDLRSELRNPVFARMTAPNVGISVQDAYYALHHKEIHAASMQVAAQTVARKISNDIQAGNRRPVENGISGHAPSVTTFDYSKASPEQRKAFKQFIRSEAAKGRKVYPGSYSGQ